MPQGKKHARERKLPGIGINDEQIASRLMHQFWCYKQIFWYMSSFSNVVKHTWICHCCVYFYPLAISLYALHRNSNASLVTKYKLYIFLTSKMNSHYLLQMPGVFLSAPVISSFPCTTCCCTVFWSLCIKTLSLCSRMLQLKINRKYLEGKYQLQVISGEIPDLSVLDCFSKPVWEPKWTVSGYFWGFYYLCQKQNIVELILFVCLLSLLDYPFRLYYWTNWILTQRQQE